MNYYVVMQADFLKSGQTYEDINLNTIPAGHKAQWVLGATSSTLINQAENISKSFDYSYPIQITFLEQNIIKLRC